MAPRDYIQAREHPPSKEVDDFHMVLIDDKPYYPFLKVHVQDEESIKMVASRLIMTSCAATMTASGLTVSPVSGGNTNVLFRISGFCQKQQQTDDSVLLRVFGGHGLIDRDVENATFAALSRAGIAPKYFGRFANGRVEGWLSARTLTVRQVADPDLSRLIAEEMGFLHRNFRLPCDLQEYHSEPSLWEQLFDWLNRAQKATFHTPIEASMAKDLHLPSIHDELVWLQHDVIRRDAKVAFCHNDVLASNILVKDGEEKKKIHLIDFEYGGVNYVGFDIANHFNEFAGGTDVASGGIPRYNWLPSLEFQRRFVEHYVGDVDAQAVDAIMAQVEGFTLVNHLYWGLWAVVQASVEGSKEFNYIMYGTMRIQQYHKVKAAMEQTS